MVDFVEKIKICPRDKRSRLKLELSLHSSVGADPTDST